MLAGDRLLARIWLIDADPAISAEEVAVAQRAIGGIRTILLERREAIRRRVAIGSSWLEEMETAGSDRRQSLAQRLRDSFGVAALDHVHACVIERAPNPNGFGEDKHATDTEPMTTGYLCDLMERLDMRGCVGAVRNHTIIALVSIDEAETSAEQRLVAAAHQAATDHGIAVKAIGLGGALLDPNGLDTSIRQAEFTARVAARVPELEGHACWDTLGEYRMFYTYEWGPAGVAAIHPGVAALLDERRAPLVETVLAYLERHGDVSATASSLSIHRTTLYYRLDRVTRILGEDLNGAGRLQIHAALRFAWLSVL